MTLELGEPVVRTVPYPRHPSEVRIDSETSPLRPLMVQIWFQIENKVMREVEFYEA